MNIVILAAGQGKRMHSNLPKVLHPIAGKALVSHVIDTARSLSPRLARPRRRVIFVVVAVSSMNTKRCGSARIRGWRSVIHSRRRLRSSSRPHSLASRDFFI